MNRNGILSILVILFSYSLVLAGPPGPTLDNYPGAPSAPSGETYGGTLEYPVSMTYAAGDKFSGKWMGTWRGNDNDLNTVQGLVDTWLADQGLPSTHVYEYDKLEVPNSTDFSSGGTLTEGNLLVKYAAGGGYGTWETADPISMYSVKAGPYFALYWLGDNMLDSGYWTTLHTPPYDIENLKELSHLSTWVPAPGAVVLGMLGLATAGSRLRKRRRV